MHATDILIREAGPADLPGISHVRTSVKENLLTPEQLEERGITNASVAASLVAQAKGWVAELDGQIVAFSIADRSNQSIFGLFVLPDYEGRGLGKRLLDLALQWLWENGAEPVWLTTSRGTRAARFYECQGWSCSGVEPDGQLRFERKPFPATSNAPET
ncbi:MAG: GNAT family N-acetyltransferase [Hyphomicrobiales bacterium]